MVVHSFSCQSANERCSYLILAYQANHLQTSKVRYARMLKIPDFRGVFKRGTLQQYPLNVECGIMNFNTSNQPGCHWVCYYRNKNERIYFDSYGQITPVEIQRYLTTGSEFDRGKEVIQEYISVWSTLPVRIEITSERRRVSINSKSHATLWISTR